MNEQLRKAIEEATYLMSWREDGVGGWVVSERDSKASQAKLLRVIELLVEQRDAAWRGDDDEFLSNKYKADAELIAAMEGK